MPRSGILAPREPAIDLVKIISEGTYTNFASALKEFVSNAYDADAARVHLSVDEDCNRITIHDDGHGMKLADFGDVYASIARGGKQPRNVPKGKTSKGRFRIGRFGIGALAIINAAGVFMVRSTKKGSNSGFEAKIDLQALRSQFGKGEDLSKWWQFQYKEWDNEPKESHYTEVVCEGLSEGVKQFLQRPGESQLGEVFGSTRQLSGIDELAWQLGIICPVVYASGYPVPSGDLKRPQDNLVFAKAGKLKKDGFEVFLNGREVKREILLPSYAKSFKANTKKQLAFQRDLGYSIRCVHSAPGLTPSYEGYLVVQAFQVVPEELRGILIRVRGVGVGWHRTFNLQAKAPSTLYPNLSGEIWVDGLDDALQFDRESFREDHPLYMQLQNQFAAILEEEAKEFRQRSARRVAKLRPPMPDAETALPGTTAPQHTGGEPDTPQQPQETVAKPPAQVRRHQPTGQELLLPLDIFAAMPDSPQSFASLLNQINGCWTWQYYEACALVCRRLLEVMIIELYTRRKLQHELHDPQTRMFIGLKRLINKLNGDARFGLGKEFTDGLDKVKSLGDIAAHDHRIRIRSSDFERATLRFSIERLASLIAQC